MLNNSCQCCCCFQQAQQRPVCTVWSRRNGVGQLLMSASSTQSIRSTVQLLIFRYQTFYCYQRNIVYCLQTFVLYFNL